MRICAIASGSNGNCYYFENYNEAVLIDAGVSCKQIVLRMEKLGLDVNKVKGVFITHEHGDHIRGVNVFCKKFQIPVYITKATLENSKITLDPSLIKFINADDSTKIGDIVVNSFSKNHDAADPCSFKVSCNDKNVCVLTDIGKECDNVINNIKDSHAIFLETNYDEEMLWNGAYPYYLKSRVSGENGHLSNLQAATLILDHGQSSLEHVFLSHLSENNNCPKIALSTFETLVKERQDLEINTVITSRDESTGIYYLK